MQNLLIIVNSVVVQIPRVVRSFPDEARHILCCDSHALRRHHHPHRRHGSIISPACPRIAGGTNPHQVPKPFEVGILKWSQDVYNAGHTSEQEAQRCSSATPMLPTQLGQTTNQAATNCSTRAIGFVEFITASLVHLVVKVTKPVPGYQGITPAPKPANGEINLSNANVLPRD